MAIPPTRRGAHPEEVVSADDGDDLGARMLTSGDIARLVSVDLKTVHNWVRVGHLAGLKTRGGHLRFHRAEVVRFMRRFGFPVSSPLRGEAARVAVVGARLASSRGNAPGARPVEAYPHLFDAALAAADGAYDLLVVDLDLAEVGLTTELVRALRRHAPTRALPVVGVSAAPATREGFVRGGGDAAVATPSDLDRVRRFWTGD
ncbi:MAG: helix-turn-helix domain-containing protein [Polyangiaceae bacterium]|nr:helix-turn-helix domain-containing protein [Polyangiaceae bacterium]